MHHTGQPFGSLMYVEQFRPKESSPRNSQFGLVTQCFKVAVELQFPTIYKETFDTNKFDENC